MKQPSSQTVREHLLVPPGEGLRLAERPTRDRALFEDKQEARTSLEDDTFAIDELQDRLYAVRDRALLVVLQGLDTSGKSGVIRKVFAQTSPLGMQVRAFKAPSATERAHDYLWRIHAAVPPMGFIGIFDRSHYEDVLVVRVRGLAPLDVVEARYDQINRFERNLVENGVSVLKFMLHVGREEQGERLRERIVEPHKRWKFNPGDLEDRRMWDDYMLAYELALSRCSSARAPWYVVPSDSRTRRNAMIARIVRGALEDMQLEWPDPGHRLEDHDFS